MANQDIYIPKETVAKLDKRTPWERHLDYGGGESKYFKDEEEFNKASKKFKRDMKTRNLRGGKELINEDGEPSTVRLRNEYKEGQWAAFPTLFYNEKDGWLDLGENKQIDEAYEYAKSLDEVEYFGEDSTSASNYAHGDWKPKRSIEEKFIKSTEE